MSKDFTASITVSQSPEAVFNAINNVRGWWSEQIKGDTDKLNAAFRYNYKDVHICRMKIIEFIPGKQVTWLVLENHFNFIKDQSEWVNTKISFEISREGDKTHLQFTHIGLVPDYECFDICNKAWTGYITKSLFDLITKGKGQPNPIEEVVSEAETKAAGNAAN